MTRGELKTQIDDLMQQYADEEIDKATYVQKMIELTTTSSLLEATKIYLIPIRTKDMF